MPLRGVDGSWNGQDGAVLCTGGGAAAGCGGRGYMDGAVERSAAVGPETCAQTEFGTAFRATQPYIGMRSERVKD